MPLTMLFHRASAGGGGGGANGYYRALTVDHTKLGASDLSDFPVLLDVTDATLKSVSNGGHVTRTDGFDIFVTTTATGSTQLKFERELYDPATGRVLLWIKAASLSHTSDTTFGYLRYGDSTTTTDQSDHANVWDASFAVVYHLGTGSSLSLTDSTANGLNLGNSGTVAATTGKVYGGALFDQTNNLGHADNGTLRPASAFTVEAWITPTVGSTGYRTIFAKGSGPNRNYDLDLENGTDKPRIVCTQGATNYKVVTATSGVTLGNPYRVVGTYDGATLKLYVNGVSTGTPLSMTGGVDTDANEMDLGFLPGTSDYYKGMIDEARLSSIGRSADWVLSDYNNQNSPGTFTTVGAETAI